MKDVTRGTTSYSPGRPLEIFDGDERQATMWVYDGEEWTQDNGSERSPAKPEIPLCRWDELMPELQVIEIVPVRRNTDVPPLPMP